MADWHRAAEESSLPEGELLGIVVEGKKVVLARVDGVVYALEDRCSHADFPLHDGILKGTTLQCIRHGAQFDVCSGKATRFPAIRPVPVYEVELRDGGIHIRLP